MFVTVIDKSENGTAQVIQLSNGEVEECKSKTHPHYLKLSTQCSGPEKIIFLSFDTFTDYSKWLKKCKKVSGLDVVIYCQYR